MNLIRSIAITIQVFILFSVIAQNKVEPVENRRPESIFNTDVPTHTLDVILARPTDKSVTISILSYIDIELTLVYHKRTERTTKQVDISCQAGKCAEVVLKELSPNCSYQYTLYKKQALKLSLVQGHFQTARSFNAPFTFTITADSHLDEKADTEVYKATMLNIVSDTADFHFDLGDTFMTDKYRDNYKKALNQYIAQRFYLGLVATSSPLFFVQGNHDGEAGQRLNGTENNMAVWSNQTRKAYFPNPIPDNFYRGNTNEDRYCGKIQNYYSFHWGNSLFVVLDPFWYTARTGMDNAWDRTLGKEQYEWLRTTLEQSKATFKFVFIHNLVGGADLKGKARGGMEAADKYEWGGKNADGTEGFKQQRPNWEMPIHSLLIKNNVTAVFHGHDHIYAHQQLDGIIYQCLSQPGAKDKGNTRHASDYDYRNGTILNAPGYLRVNVQPDKVNFQWIETNTQDNKQNKSILHEYQLFKH